MRKLIVLIGMLLAAGAGADPASADGMPDGDVYVPIGEAVAPGIVTAPWYSGIYVSANGGGSWLYDIDADTGYNVGGAIGYRINENWRAELNTSYREADVDILKAGPSSRTTETHDALPIGTYNAGSDDGSGEGRSGGGGVNTTSVTPTVMRSSSSMGVITPMANAYYDMPIWLGGDTPVVPFIGLGVGLGVITTDGMSDEYEFAWNVLGGVGYNVWRNLHTEIGYRYLQTTNPSFIEPVLSHEAIFGGRWEF